MNAIKLRKMCNNCKMNVIHSNAQIDLTEYGQTTTSDSIQCENCGYEESETV